MIVRKVHFPNTLDVRFHRYEQGVVWEVLAPFIIVVNPHEADQRIKRIPSGRLVDFASVPRIPLVYMAYANKFHLPAVGHDNDYAIGGTEEDRTLADHDFLWGMLGTATHYETQEDAYAMFDAVRQFGSRHFKYA